MEGSSREGCRPWSSVQITRATYELLADEFECEARGTIAVKGKGDVEVWYLVGPRGDRATDEFGAVRGSVGT